MTIGSLRTLTLILTLGACAKARPPDYARPADLAEKAYGSGRYAEAARHWLAAAKAAPERRARIEAEFRAAASFERAKDFARAEALYERLASESEPNERSARAVYARAYLEIESGSVADGQAMLDRALRQNPGSGLAPTALARRLSHVREQAGSEGVISYLDALFVALQNSDLAENICYFRARELDRLGATLEARDAYLETARRFPYPGGAYWDDALFRAAQCDLRLGRAEAAIASLERMLGERERAHLQGSYERPRYAEARFLIAETYRDKLGQPDRARREFRKVYSDHPTSLLCDDALWNEAITAARSGDSHAACAPLQILRKELADSRFAPCASELCPSLQPLPARRCHAYVVRDLRDTAAKAP